MGLISQLAVFLAAASAVVADPHISSISFSGNGCPQDAKFTGGLNNPCVTFPDFSLSLPGRNFTANCQAHIVATTSPGWQYTLKSNTVKGRVSLSPGTTLNTYTTIYFSQNAASTETLRGSLSNSGSGNINQDVTLYAQGTESVWSPCIGADGNAGILNINFRGALTGSGKALFEADTEEWDFDWRQC